MREVLPSGMERKVRKRNARVDWLVRWAATHDLMITNTHFAKNIEDTWTYSNNDIARQLDYILIDLILTN